MKTLHKITSFNMKLIKILNTSTYGNYQIYSIKFILMIVLYSIMIKFIIKKIIKPFNLANQINFWWI